MYWLLFGGLMIISSATLSTPDSKRDSKSNEDGDAISFNNANTPFAVFATVAARANRACTRRDFDDGLNGGRTIGNGNNECLAGAESVIDLVQLRFGQLHHRVLFPHDHVHRGRAGHLRLHAGWRRSGLAHLDDG